MKVTFPELALVERTEDLLRIYTERTRGPIRERARELVLEVLVYVPRLLNMDLMMTAEMARQEVNVEPTREVVSLLRTAPKLQEIADVLKRAGNDPEEISASLEQELTLVERGDYDQDVLSLFALFRLLLSKRLHDLRLITDNDSAAVDRLYEIVKTAIESWPIELLEAQFREARSEFVTDISQMGFQRSEAPPALFEPTEPTAELMRETLASYIARDRPRLVQLSIRRGQETWPDRAPSLASVLLDMPKLGGPAPVSPTLAQARAFDALLRVLTLSLAVYGDANETLFRNAADIGRRLGNIRSAARLISMWRGNSGAEFVPVLLVELKGLIRDLGILTQATNIEAVLRNYKLRNEVINRDSGHPDLDPRDHEIYFQRHLAAYLIDHGIPSYGTKFGRMETDAIVEAYPAEEQFVVETKIIRAKARDSQVRDLILAAFLQLKKYMNDLHIRRRGVLLVYCFAPIVFSSPIEWIRGSYAVVIVDLAQETASSRQRTIDITEGALGSPELQVTISTPESSKARRRRAAS